MKDKILYFTFKFLGYFIPAIFIFLFCIGIIINENNSFLVYLMEFLLSLNIYQMLFTDNLTKDLRNI